MFISIYYYVGIIAIVPVIIGLYTFAIIKGKKVTRIVLVLIAVVLVYIASVGIFSVGMKFGESLFARTVRPSLERMVTQLDSWRREKEYDKISRAIANLKTGLGSNNYKPSIITFFSLLFERAIREDNRPSIPMQIEAKQTKLTPRNDALYTLVTPPMLYEIHEGSPKDETELRAWKLANEFVFRTSLREQVQLPAQKAIQHKIGVMVIFAGKESNKKIRILVRSDMKTIEYIGDR